MNHDHSLDELHQRIAALRRDLHAHPELAFSEARTSDAVAAALTRLGIEVHRGLAKTGVVGRLRMGSGEGPAIGLRADMDALPLEELNSFPHRSRHEGRMHACGHDGHTAMLLGAAEVLAARREGGPNGIVHFIFQPAEEHEGGGRVMVEEGLFERFPMERVFGLHNWPGLPAGRFAVMAGPIMAGTDRFDITITGRGGHAAMPHQARDTVLAGAALVQSLQSLVSRSADPLEPAVVSVTRFHAGHADNVLPETAELGGTTRAFDPETQEMLATGMRRICQGIELAHGVEIRLQYRRGYPPTINDAGATQLCREAAAEVSGGEQALVAAKPSMGAEDFAYLSNVVPGCYVWLGNGPGEGGCMLHSPHYDFNDAVIPTGIRYWVRLAEKALTP
ncbi:MAG: amidohydrolase [Gammaproteobacteria bacterium]|nr:amidohydrolase [Gammaproteobacteria bacterium]MBU1414027.1 amidohydrolase [Gammaproteobacteria bacterium]